ncbi:MAG: hypothetical protein H7A09_07510 [Oceanospirillaceae bacterium]|nr:hypothetical protein [Oceanospirillaceae bacterium]
MHKDNEIIVPCHRSHIDYLLLSCTCCSKWFCTTTNCRWY